MEHFPFDPIRKQLDTTVSPDQAYTIFTERMREWWPLDSHSVFTEKSISVTFEAFAGGRLIEHGPGGAESTWGTISVAERPARLVFTWHPGRDPETAQEVEVTFTKTERGCRIELEHRGWDALGEKAAETHEGYDSGWDYVFVKRFGSMLT